MVRCPRPFLGMLASISAATLTGAVGRRVSVEVHVSNGLPGFTIVGLPDAAVREFATVSVLRCSRVVRPGRCGG